MATRYGILHRTTRQLLSVIPSISEGRYSSVPEDHPEDAATYRTMTEACLEREGLGAFASAYEVVPVTVASIYDDPDEQDDGRGFVSDILR